MPKKEICIEEAYVSFNTAKKLVKAGFTQIPRVGMEATLYDKKGKPVNYANYGVMYSGLSDGYIPRPTVQMSRQWIWEKYKVHIEGWIVKKGMWSYMLYNKKGEELEDEVIAHGHCQTYAEGIEQGILHVLKWL